MNLENAEGRRHGCARELVAGSKEKARASMMERVRREWDKDGWDGNSRSGRDVVGMLSGVWWLTVTIYELEKYKCDNGNKDSVRHKDLILTGAFTPNKDCRVNIALSLEKREFSKK